MSEHSEILVDFTIAASTVEEAQPTIDSFLSFLGKYGKVELNGPAEVYYRFPNTISAQASIYSVSITVATVDQIARDLQPPVNEGREGSYVWAWNAHTQGGGYMPAFPKIDWLALAFHPDDASTSNAFGSENLWDKEYPALKTFFQTYFKAGWRDELPTEIEPVDTAVLEYAFENSSNLQLLELQRVLEAFLGASHSVNDEQMGNILETFFYCSYYPPKFGLSHRKWLEKIDKMLGANLAERMSLR